MTREEAIEQLKLNNPFMAGKEKELFSQAIDKGIEALKNQNTGHWIKITNGAIREKYICSECRRQIEDCGIENLLYIKYPYCHCGAKMEGE